MDTYYVADWDQQTIYCCELTDEEAQEARYQAGLSGTRLMTSKEWAPIGRQEPDGWMMVDAVDAAGIAFVLGSRLARRQESVAAVA